MLQVDNKDVNLGPLKFGVPHPFDYTITNNYELPIKIERIILGCHACTKATMDVIEILPKQKAPLHVIFTPGSLGIQSKTIALVASIKGAMLPQLDMRFRASVS